MLIDFLILISVSIIGIFIFTQTKDVLHPAFVLATVYFVDVLFFIIIRFVTRSTYHLNINVFYFVFGILVFYFGTLVATKKHRFIVEPIREIYTKKASILYIVFLILQCIVCLLFILDIISNVNIEQGNRLLQYLNATKSGKYEEKYIFEFFRTISICLSQVAIYKLVSKKVLSSYIKYLLIQILVAIIYVIVANNRQMLFMLIIPVVFTIFYANYNSCRNILKLVICSIFILFLIISLQCIIKKQPVSFEFLRLYLNSGIVSFSEWMKNPTERYNGGYTFRVLFTALSRLKICNIPSYWIELRYLDLPHIDWKVGNVYTFYHGFAQDFGIWYAMFIQFLVGIFNGFLYLKAKTLKSSFWAVILCIFYYPLIMHFFTEQYASHVSYWIQVFIWVYIATNTTLLYKMNN